MNGAVCQLEQLFITKSEEGVGPTAPCISYTLAGKLKKGYSIRLQIFVAFQYKNNLKSDKYLGTE
jgi:hypothetical protein